MHPRLRKVRRRAYWPADATRKPDLPDTVKILSLFHGADGWRFAVSQQCPFNRFVGRVCSGVGFCTRSAGSYGGEGCSRKCGQACYACRSWSDVLAAHGVRINGRWTGRYGLLSFGLVLAMKAASPGRSFSCLTRQACLYSSSWLRSHCFLSCGRLARR